MSRHLSAKAAWIDVPHDLLVRRFFAGADKKTVYLEGLTPGRYWKRWSLPKDANDFDREVAKLMDKSPGPKSLEIRELENSGTFCLFYAWRVHAIAALMFASATRKSLSHENLQSLKDERTAWNRRIAQSRDILQFPSRDYNIAASIYHQPSDVDYSTVETHKTTISIRNNRIEQISKEIKSDEIIVAGLSQQIDRIEKYLIKWDGRNVPDLWRTSFFMYMANVWTHITGNNVPANKNLFTDILTAATKVGSAEATTIGRWGQEKALRGLFGKSGEGEGFRRGETGWLCLEESDGVAARGDEISKLIDLHKIQNKNKGRELPLLNSVFLMREYSEGVCSIIMQHEVLKNIMIDKGLWSERLGIQLGWIEKDRREIEECIYLAIHLAKCGDTSAISVLRCAHLFNPRFRSLIDNKGSWSPFTGPTVQDITATLIAPSAPDVPVVLIDGNQRSLHAAITLLNAYTPT